MSDFLNKLFSAQTVFILALINFAIAIFTGNVPAICGWLVAAIGAGQLMILGK